MVDAKRLESRLTAAIKLAQDLYEDAEPISIWDSFYEAISRLPMRQQLLIAGEALKELAQITLLKSESIHLNYGRSDEFSDEFADEEMGEDAEGAGVILGEAWLNDLVLKTSSLDLSRFAKPDTRLRMPGEGLFDEIMGELEEIEPLPLDDSPKNLDEALAIAHVESVSDWQAKILMVLEQESAPIDFWLLRGKTQLPPSALFLGLLLGSDSWQLRRNYAASEDGYYGSILVSIDDFEDFEE